NASMVFGGIDTGGRSIWCYDGESRSFFQMEASDIVMPLEGIWVYSRSNTLLPLAYLDDPIQSPAMKHLPAGWNAIGFSDITPSAARDAFQSVRDEWTIAIGFDASGQRYESSIINGGSSGHSDTLPMYPGHGYWLFMREPGDLASIGA
ncbi:MAG: hypothetical protein LUQ25_00210, partial [Methanoregulaceae archaeon]|nr:hypothetical protein [Methanoregulaceae archaeon]